ncbi:hypothetical protein [Cyanobium sp. WAJ14-Wanaka]|uniref:hypothetical protein n=1 Tax=Cyanobium sp. WAJ14-Wanaka TaxID=2823725 RepID=UPI0020CD1900|nr:hypothetical protein [Cyanobium sp. WAJ14-Wanaka]MCP9774477.1 hypothetical protein [Cyanobium sp. WAJ14-Wanaka]
MILPALSLSLFPRPRAQGLERLLGHASLLQSFPVQPRLATPPLWNQLLGPQLANQAWNRPGLWWQFWAEHGNGQPFLAISWAALSSQAQRQLPANSLRVDDLLVVAPDPLSQKLLGGELRTKQRRGRGLDQRCLGRLQQQQSVYWRPAGLGALLGPMAPLLQRFQQGCMSFELQGNQLLFSGESTATEGLWVDGLRASSPSNSSQPLDAKVLLEMGGPGLGILLDGLLNRQLVRQPLQDRYGIGASQLAVIRKTPFVLQLRPVAKGPFQAALQLHLAVGNQRRAWAEILQGLRQPLLAQGLSDGPAVPSAPAATIRSTALPAAQWRNGDGVLLGGWRWLVQAGRDPELLVFLGPDQAGPDPAGSYTQTELRLRPAALARLNLLPPDLPGAVQRSVQLELAAGGVPSQPLSQLSGRLQWDRLR